MNRLLVVACAAAVAAWGCEAETRRAPGSRPAAAAIEAKAAYVDDASPAVHAPPPSREGGALVRSPIEQALYLADEDHGVVRRIELPIDIRREAAALKVPGRPAQVLALSNRILVTVRDAELDAENEDGEPIHAGLLVALSPGETGREIGRAELPLDAWGLTISADEKTAFVTSAWTHKVSAIDLGTMNVKWSVDVPREPRAVVATSDGAALYVTHLVGSALTKIEALGGATPRVRSIDLPADPARTRVHDRATATLAYAAVASPDGSRLYVPRHALGTLVSDGWSGTQTVDVLVTADDTPLAATRRMPAIGTLPQEELDSEHPSTDAAGALGQWSSATFAQPRAVAYVKRNDTLLVLGEGNNVVSELDALSIAPALSPVRQHFVAGRIPTGEANINLPESCGAPTGVALSEDEKTAWVFCRSTSDLVILTLAGPDGSEPVQGPIPWVRLVEEADGDQVALGKRLFYDATEPVVSGGLGCAACHPEGRDDGFVWHEIMGPSQKPILVASPLFQPEVFSQEHPQLLGYARQTPMLAGRVNATGPYGWHGESATLVDRVSAGFGLHRFWSNEVDKKSLRARAEPIAAFLRQGLVPPPKQRRSLSRVEARGKEIFVSEQARCATCHLPANDFTDHSKVPFAMTTLPGFDPEEDSMFRVPSLFHVGETAPYYHDGSVPTLEQLIEKNHDRMGRTSHLSAEDKAALIAFLRTL